jgi:hypothetical protein
MNTRKAKIVATGSPFKIWDVVEHVEKGEEDEIAGGVDSEDISCSETANMVFDAIDDAEVVTKHEVDEIRRQ